MNPTVQGRRHLSPIYQEARRSSVQRQRQLTAAVHSTLQSDIDAFTAPPDIWFNFAILADRLDMEEEESLMLRAGLRQWPEDVDLLCGTLQNAYNTFSIDYDPAVAKQVWDRLERMPRTQTGPHWRFWSFGANYCTRFLRDPAKALALLDEGLRYVKRDGLKDILRSYRIVLVDSEPIRPLRTEQEVENYQAEALALLEDRYKLGIRLGVEDGYVLARDLARLFQERAGARAAARQEQPAHQAQARTNEDLERAIFYIKLAEILYTSGINHPIEDIYLQRARILMAQGNYREAQNILQSLPEHVREDSSNATMLRLAILSTGGKLDDDGFSEEQRDELISGAILQLFESSGTNLLSIALANPEIAQVIVQVAGRLVEEESRS